MFEKTFCSSPWFHVRLTYDGGFEKCRWTKNRETQDNVQTTSLLRYFNSDDMNQFRQQMLSGNAPEECETCHYQDQFGKVSGRKKQLLKSGVREEDFFNSFLSSPHFKDFKFSYASYGQTTRTPVDLQADLGNLCNSACIMCHPRASSRLVQDYKKLSKTSRLFIEPETYRSWVDSPWAMDSFLKDLSKIEDLKYLHLLGGETLYNRAFYDICNHLIRTGQSGQMILGTTTNGTIYTEELEQLIPEFEEFHLGISIESVTALNDYIRYPSEISSVLANIDRFLKLREQHKGLHLSLRITPNIFTVYELDQLFEYMIKNNITAESCDILHEPECLRIELLPDDIRQEIVYKLETLVAKYSLSRTGVVNVRNHNQTHLVIADNVIEYLNFIKNFEVPDNKTASLKQLVEFLRSFESLRNNRITDYAPRYKDFLASIGY